jgi:hypothetical protein
MLEESIIWRVQFGNRLEFKRCSLGRSFPDPFLGFPESRNLRSCDNFACMPSRFLLYNKWTILGKKLIAGSGTILLGDYFPDFNSISYGAEQGQFRSECVFLVVLLFTHHL